MKENVAIEQRFKDIDDNSVWRTPDEFRTIFAKAGFDILLDITQPGMPDEIHEIKCFVLRPS